MAPKNKSAADSMSPEELEKALFVAPPTDPQVLEEHVRQLLMRAQVSWLSKRDVLDILTNWREYSLPISLMPPDQPGPGSLFLFDRTQLKSFRRDNHVWKSKAGGKTVQETHEKLKIDGGIPALNCYYAHSADGTLQRRCYWKLAGNPNIVLIHYRSPGNIKGRATNAATPLHLQDRNGAGAEASTSLAGSPAQGDTDAGVAGAVDATMYQANPATAVDGVAYHPDPSIAVPCPDGATPAPDGDVDSSVPAPNPGGMIVPAPPAIAGPPGSSIPAAHGWEYSTSRDWYHHDSMNAVQPAAWQSSLPAEIIHAASQPPASDQLVMHQPYVDGAQHQQVQHHEAVDDGAHEMPHMHRVIEDHHAAHAVLPPPEQPELYSNGEEDFRHMEAAAALSPALKEGLDEAIHVEATVPDDNGVNDGSKRHHTTHPAHVEPALKPDSVPASVILDSIVDTVEPDSKRARTHEELLTLTAE